jgi:DNA polymerase III delta prime subunit
MKIEKAIRKSLPAHICLYGESSSGKTLTALKLAHGLINQGERVCVIDTENHRASHYDVDFDFDVINLEAPFSPEKFIEAINIIQNGGYKAIIIDSISHEWDSIGGVIDMAENSTNKSGLAAWGKPKKEHKKLMDCILSSKAHVICCAKAKDKLKQVKNDKGKSEIIPKGFLPIQEATFMYDMLLNIKMVKNGEFKIMKCPKNLDLKINEKTKYLDESHGKRIAEWIKQGQSLDMDFLKLQKEARLVAMEGEKTFKDWFAKLSVEKQNLFSLEFKKELIAIYKDVNDAENNDDESVKKISKIFTPTKAPVD